ncbi:unnamed protein product [Prunus brigantina]
MQTSKGNWEPRNWPTTYKSGRWIGKSSSDRSTLNTTTYKHRNVTGEWGNWPTTCADMSGWWLRKSWSDNCTCIHLKAVGNEETSQPPLQTNGALIGKGGNWVTNYAEMSGSTCKHLKATRNGESGQLPMQTNRVSG